MEIQWRAMHLNPVLSATRFSRGRICLKSFARLQTGHGRFLDRIWKEQCLYQFPVSRAKNGAGSYAREVEVRLLSRCHLMLKWQGRWCSKNGLVMLAQRWEMEYRSVVRLQLIQSYSCIAHDFSTFGLWWKTRPFILCPLVFATVCSFCNTDASCTDTECLDWSLIQMW